MELWNTVKLFPERRHSTDTRHLELSSHPELVSGSPTLTITQMITCFEKKTFSPTKFHFDFFTNDTLKNYRSFFIPAMQE